MSLMGLQAIYPKPKTSKPGPGHQVHPYLLCGLKITQPTQVWCADITSWIGSVAMSWPDGFPTL